MAMTKAGKATAPWDLTLAERERRVLHEQQKEQEALLAARQHAHWRDVRTDASFLERSRRRKPGALRANERYVRDDLHCGITGCTVCEESPAVRAFRPARCMQRDHAEYVVPDAFSLLQCMELLEEPQFGATVPHLLVLETVLKDALRIAPSRDATRLRNFFRDDRRLVETCCVVLFPDQHHEATSVDTQVLIADEQPPYIQHASHGGYQRVDPVSASTAAEEVAATSLESRQHRDARAILKTLTWYATQGHVAPSSRVVFLTPDVGSSLSLKLKRTSRNVTVETCEDLLRRRFSDPGFLLELAENTADAIHWWQEQQQQQQSEDGAGDSDGVVMPTGEFMPHLSASQLASRLEGGELLRGKLDVSTHNPMEAFVKVKNAAHSRNILPAGVEKVFVYGREAMNRGIHGDDVAIELLPRHEWMAPQSARVLVHYANEEGGAGEHGKPGSVDNDDGLENDEENVTNADAIPTGIVVGVLRRSSQFVVATVLSSTVSPGDDHALAIPMDMRIPKVRIRSQRMDVLLDQRLKVVIDHWPMDSMYPSGHYTSILGATGHLSTELSAILVQNDIEEAPFCEAALACLPECDIATYQIQECSTAKRPEQGAPLMDWAVPTDECSRRLDLRSTHRVFSVDPPGCQDIDDAMSVRRLENGNIELGVHIADVSYFVKHDSSLDFEGRSRATTVYLVGQRLDMLPCVLSADLCSLHEHVDRLTMSVIWELDGKTLDVIEDKTWYGRTVIRSCSSMTYDQAHRILRGVNADTAHAKPHQSSSSSSSSALSASGLSSSASSSGGSSASASTASGHRRGVAGGPIPLALQHELAGDLYLLTVISRKLARSRGEDGGLDLSRSETFSLNVTELGAGVEIVMKECLEIHSTIAELMILANAYVAEKIVAAFPHSALLRRHPPPSGKRFTQLVKMAEAKEIAIDATNNYTLQQSLVNAERSGRADAKTMSLLKSLAVRIMTEAEYVCASDVAAASDAAVNNDITRFAHYGLGLQYYTHFTSPIRRYADVVVHRQLLAAVEKDSQVISQGDVGTSSRRAIQTLPPSLAPSVLHGDGDGCNDDEMDLLLADVDSKLQVDGTATASSSAAHQVSNTKEDPFFPASVLVPLAQHLNTKNRNAKQASRLCEELFLALYFSSHPVRTTAIITALKQNGFLVYVPTYDLRAPVYIRDRDGVVQMDPLLCGVRIVDTLPPSGAFASSQTAAAECIRMIPQAHLQYDAEGERLDVLVPDKNAVNSNSESKSGCTFRMLDDIEVQISCDLSVSSARVPQLQLLLVGRVDKSKTKIRAMRKPTVPTGRGKTDESKSIPELQRFVQNRSAAQESEAAAAAGSGEARAKSVLETSPAQSLYDLLMSKPKPPTITPPKRVQLLTKRAIPKSVSKEKRKESVAAVVRRPGPGRLVFGDYDPPITQHYQQKLASYKHQRSDALNEELNIHRIGDNSGVAKGGADEMKRLEREAISRTLKLQAEKRHDKVNRRSKAGH